MKKTLLDFITGCVTPQEARRFYRALGGPDETEKFLEKVQKHYQADNPTVRNFFGHLTKKLFGLEKSPLDLTPEEISRLSEVVEDRQDTIAYQVKLVPKNFEIPPGEDLVTYVTNMLPRVYTRFKAYFTNPQDLMLVRSTDDKPAAINIKTRKRIVKEALEMLQVKPDVIQKIMAGEDIENDVKKQGETYSVDFSTVVDAEKLDKINPADLKKFGQVANTFMAKRGDGKVTIRNEKTPRDASFTFKGDLEMLGELFYAARRDEGSTYFPLDFSNDARIASILKTLAADRKA